MATIDTTRRSPTPGGADEQRAAGDATRPGAAPTSERPAPEDPARRAAREFGEVLGEAGDREGLDAVLRPAAAAFCRLAGVGRCSLYLVDARSGRYRGRLGHPSSLDAPVRRLTMAGPSDALTADVLRLGAPIAVPDVTRDPRTARSVMRDHHVCSVLAVPMVHAGRVLGLAFVDDEGRRHDFTDDQQRTAAAFGVLVARWIDRSLRVAQLGVVRDELARERTTLRRATLVERRLAEVGDGGFDEVLAAIADLAGRPAEVVGPDGALLARAAPGDAAGATLGPQGSRAVLRQLVGVEVGQGRTIEPDLGRGLRHRCMATPIHVDGGARGFLALVERDTRVGSFDLLLAVRGAAALAAAGRQRHTVDLARDDARALLFAQLLGEPLGGGDLPGLAGRLGVHDGPRLVAVVEPAPADGPAALVAALAPLAAVAVELQTGIALVVDAPADVGSRAAAGEVRDMLVAALRAAGAGPAGAVAVSAVCRDLGALARALQQTRALLRSARPADPGAAEPVGLTVDELGPARLLLTDASDAGRMGEEVLGPLLDPDPSVRDLLRTLTTFYACASSIRGTATELDVHENTVRHRFGRIRVLTGLDVAGDVDDQLMARAALSALRLAGSALIDPDTTDG